MAYFTHFPEQYILHTLANISPPTIDRHLICIGLGALYHYFHPPIRVGRNFESYATDMPSRIDSISRNMRRILRQGPGRNEATLNTGPPKTEETR